MNNIEVGSKVRLKSGGPLMTVRKIKEWQGQMEATCDWFDGNKPIYGTFPLSSLKLEEESDRQQSAFSPENASGGDGSWMR